ncbi:hypothetical protein JX265_005197 [Neoarthrinium moseri]|uniref:Uncharacterized protein n=1 Tax=Neoarthrinium moseri TaxID=1658444 RepID=A0A9P9WPI9_9PEZI|nr:uncharacterized protein JN550_007645 [Neoarthrinium moseri]KAI1845334.1 hypothetical protein JX266_008429 [Neoarthrinium moseri]KAI1866257.1 hypothetical protein JN550_007645 [Neoarthrinium moseri]KAI1873575.1 hypothetical protein JX265_005197 [Neoarthrinium moseri]
MRPTSLVFAAAIPAICAVQPRSAPQVPVLLSHDAGTAGPYAQGPANITQTTAATSSPAESMDSSKSPSAAAASSDIPPPTLDKSIFSLIVFGVAGLCLL